MNKLDKQIIRSAKRLAQKECSNYADGSCLPEGCTCYAVNPAYVTIHDGAIGCDYFLKAVQPTAPELSTAVWHEIFREEEAAGEGWKACVRCHKPFLPSSNHQRYCAECGTAAKQTRRREKQHRYRARKNIPAQRYLLEQKKARKNKISRTPRRAGRYLRAQEKGKAPKSGNEDHYPALVCFYVIIAACLLIRWHILGSSINPPESR